MDIDTTIVEMNGYQLRRHRIIIERLCPIYQERKRNQMEDRNRLNSDTVVMLQTDPYEIRLMQNPYDAAVGWAKETGLGVITRKMRHTTLRNSGTAHFFSYRAA